MKKQARTWLVSMSTIRKTALGSFISLLCFGSVANAQAIKIGYTRMDYIVSQTPEAKIITNLLTTQQTQAETELKRMQQELQDKYAAYQKSAAQLTDIVRKDRETEIQSLQTRIQEFNKTANESIQNQYKKLITPVMTKIQQTIDLVAKENGYTHILSAGSGNASDLLYTSEENNITDLVLKKLDITPGQTAAKPGKAPAAPAKSTTAPAKTAAPKKK